MIKRYAMLAVACGLVFPAGAQAADPAPVAGQGKSSMTTGFTPPEKRASGPRSWTHADLIRARQAEKRRQNKPPRCEQDRLLTDKAPCDSSIR